MALSLSFRENIFVKTEKKKKNQNIGHVLLINKATQICTVSIIICHSQNKMKSLSFRENIFVKTEKKKKKKKSEYWSRSLNKQSYTNMYCLNYYLSFSKQDEITGSIIYKQCLQSVGHKYPHTLKHQSLKNYEVQVIIEKYLLCLQCTDRCPLDALNVQHLHLESQKQIHPQ